MYEDLSGKVAVVTGGARGIGKVICLKLADQEVHIVVNDITRDENTDSLIEQLKDFGVRALFVQADISKLEEAKALINGVNDEFGKIDILINNAGITRDNLLLRMKEKDWDDVIAVNLKGTFNCMQAAARHMMKQRSGAIINISSIVGVYGNPGQVNYSASKAGVIGLTKTVAKELAPRGVRVNAIAPGFIETEMTKKIPEEKQKLVIEKIPLGKFGTPDDVALLVSFLVSDEAKYITGQIIGLDGGLVI